ncbi:MAG: ABC transporter substrate-binding protein [Deltaproteobacteria bacterium]|nr:ABC transporter substrate-binding protein [Deltaproteobacteria bacterium]
MKRILTGIFFFLLSAAGSAAAEPVRLVLQWQHQSQFAGYYMALEKGFYRAENLDVTLIPGGAHVDPLRMIRDGQADFCTTMLSSVLGRHDRNEFVLLQQVLNRSNLTLVAWKKGRHGIDSIAAPSDLDQRRITLWDGFRPPYEAFFRRYGIDPVIIPQYYSFSLFLHRGADACCAMRYNEYHSLIQHGLRDEELTVFDFHELGVDLPEDGLFAVAETWRRRLSVCDAFVRASMKGWQYARDHRRETLDVVMRYVEEARLPANRPHMEWMLDTILQAVFPATDAGWIPGQLTEERYRKAVSILGLEGSEPAYGDFVTPGAQRGLH